MRRYLSPLPLLAVALIAPHVAVPAATMTVQSDRIEPFSEAALFIELNHTDGDLGIHASIDGGPWTALQIMSGTGRELLEIASRGRLQRQGLTQLFFESAEPSFDELDPMDFFNRFPEGAYVITGRGERGATFASTAVLSHVLAAPPQNVYVSGLPAATSCDDDPLPSVVPPVVIQWDPVVASHHTIGVPGTFAVRRYQLFVERNMVELALDLPPTMTAFEIPEAVTAVGDEFKFEIIVQTDMGNNTAIESCFRVLP
ncbi:MAG: hypothetical protein ACT4QD_13385 [Acidobacteriota bacterium]